MKTEFVSFDKSKMKSMDEETRNNLIEEIKSFK